MERACRGRLVGLLLSPRRHLRLPQRRRLSDAEATAALRPFYFAVHPDLFARHPEIATVNERALKLLHAHLAAAQPRPASADEQKLTFYLRKTHDHTQTAKDGHFHKVSVSLAAGSALETVRSVLSGANLSTEHLPEPPTPRPPPTSAWTHYNEEQINAFVRRKAASTATPALRLQLASLRAERELKRKAAAAIDAEAQRTVEDIRRKTGLAEIVCASGWALSHSRGALAAFQRLLAAGHLRALQLSGQRLRFARRGSFCAVDGTLCLGLDDVPETWLKLLVFWTATPGFLQEYLSDVQRESRRVSGLLRGASLRAPEGAKALAHLGHLRRLGETLDAATQSFAHGLVLGEAVEVVVEGGASGLLMDHQGRLHLPANVARRELEPWLRDALPVAKSRALAARRAAEALAHTAEEAKAELLLQSLGWEQSLPTGLLTECLERLGELGQEEKGPLEGARLRIVNPTSPPLLRVAQDGALLIPINWQL